MGLRAIAFDFDGVLVESAEVKTKAFRQLFSSESPEAVEQIVEYHLKNAGISRFVKFETIYRDILKRPLSRSEFSQLGEKFAEAVLGEVVACPWVDGAREFFQKYRERYSFFIVSGTPETELQEIVRQRRISELFVEVLGSPKSKEILLKEILLKYELCPEEMLFVGDSETDWRAAQQVGVRFILRNAPGTPRPPEFSGSSILSLASLSQHLSAV